MVSGELSELVTQSHTGDELWRVVVQCVILPSAEWLGVTLLLNIHHTPVRSFTFLRRWRAAKRTPITYCAIVAQSSVVYRWWICSTVQEWLTRRHRKDITGNHIKREYRNSLAAKLLTLCCVRYGQ